MAMLPVSIPRTSFWRHAVAPDHDTTGNRELDLAQERYRAGDQLASRAHLYRMQWASAVPSQALMLRALSLECLLDAGDVVVGSMLLGGARRPMSAEEAKAIAATASRQTPAPVVPSWRERLLSKRWAARLGAAADSALAPWIELFDAWQCYQYGDADAAYDSWNRLYHSDGLDPLIKGYAALGVVQTASERLVATTQTVWLNEASNVVFRAYSSFRTAENLGGCGQSLLLGAELHYLTRNVPMGRHELDEAKDHFERAASVAGLAEVNLIRALGEGLNGNAEPVAPALLAAEDAVGVRRVPAQQIDALIEFSHRLPQLMGNNNGEDLEQGLATAREFQRWAVSTGDPMLQLISLRILSKLLEESARLGESLFYGSVRGDLLSRYCASISLRLRIHRAALADYDFLVRRGGLENAEHPAFQQDYTIFAAGIISAKAQTRENWLRVVRHTWLAGSPGEEWPELPLKDEGFETTLGTLCGQAEEARRQFREHLGAGDRHAACDSLSALFEHHYAMQAFLNQHGFFPEFDKQNVEIDASASETGKNTYQIHARASGLYQAEIMPQTRLDLLEQQCCLTATRDVLLSALLGDERLLAKAAADLASFYESYRSHRTFPDMLNEPLVHAGAALFWTAASPDRDDHFRRLFHRAANVNAHDYLEQRIKTEMSKDPMAPARSYNGGGKEAQEARALFQSGWKLDQANSAVGSRQTTVDRLSGETVLRLNDVFSARFEIRKDSEFFGVPEPASGVDFETRAGAVRSFFDCPAIPTGPSRFDKVLQAFHRKKQLEARFAPHAGMTFTEMIEQLNPLRALLDAGQIALSVKREDDFVPVAGFRSFAACQNMLRSDPMALRLVAMAARAAPTLPAEPAENQPDLVFQAHMAALGCTLPYRPLVLLLLGQPEAAARAAESPDEEGASARNAISLALHAIAAGDYGRAITALGPVPAALRTSNPQEVFQAEYLLALCHRRAGNEDAEFHALRATTEELERVRRSLRTRNQVLATREVRRPIYEDYLGALHAKQRYSEMASAMRRYRCSSQMPIAALEAEANDSELKRLVRETTLLYDVLSREAVWEVEDSNLWAIIGQTLWGTAMDRDASRANVTDGLNRIADILVDQIRPAASVAAAESTAPLDGLAISYFVGAHGVYRVASASNVSGVRYSPIEEVRLTELCHSFRAAIERGEAPEESLSGLLLGGLAELADFENLYLTLDGVLNLIPFQALQGETGRYLIEDHTITYLGEPPRVQSDTAILGRRILVAGNPDGSLPAAEEEARAIAKLAGFEAGKPLLRGAATIENLRARLADADLVHLATHARANEAHPNFGYLQLARWDRLYSIDLGGLPFAGKHVFLSACETRIGEVISGEDVYGVADAFLAAGAPSVIATLWRIEDESCAQFAQLYYSFLARAGGPAMALAQAAREFIGSDGLKAPFFWAGFNHLSATRPVRSVGLSSAVPARLR